MTGSAACTRSRPSRAGIDRITSGEFGDVVVGERLVAVAQRLGGLGVHVDDHAVSSDRDRGPGQRQDQVASAARVRRIDDDRQMRQPLGDRDGADVERVAGRRLERPDAALAENDVEVATLRDVLGRHQPLLDRGVHAALQHDRLAGRADGLEQREVLHVPGTDLQHVGVRADQVHAGRVDHLGDDRHPGLGPDLSQDLQVQPRRVPGTRKAMFAA